MLFSTFAAAAFATLVASVSAAVGSNGFTAPIAGDIITAGQPYTFKWINLVGSTVTLTLRSGNVNNLNTITTIVTGIPNTGSYTWNVPSTTFYGSDYSVAIAWGTGASDMNFSDRIILNSAFTSGVSTQSSTSTTSATSTTGTTTASPSITTTATSSKAATTGTTTTQASSSGSLTTSRRSSSTSAASSSGSSTGTAATASPTVPGSGSQFLASPLAIIMCLFAAIIYTN